jgi:putative ABC transport system permease protein
MFAFIIAAPIAWLGMNKWLENFAYRTQVSWWIFLLAGAGMIAIALFALGCHPALKLSRVFCPLAR